MGITEQDAVSVAHVAEGNYLKACESLQLNERINCFSIILYRSCVWPMLGK